VNSTIITRNGRETALARTAAFVLNRYGTLTRLQSLLWLRAASAWPLSARAANSACQVDAASAREGGMGETETRSTTRPGAKVQWFDIKQKSASCRVSGGNPARS
jgi:hypothetical protein